jgi:hypothetical protein
LLPKEKLGSPLSLKVKEKINPAKKIGSGITKRLKSNLRRKDQPAAF